MEVKLQIFLVIAVVVALVFSIYLAVFIPPHYKPCMNSTFLMKCTHLCDNITEKVQMVDCSKLGGDQCAVKYAKDAYYSYCNTKFNVGNRIFNCYQIYDCEIVDNLGNTYKINCSISK